MEQKLAMEKNLVAIAREIEKLRAGQMNTERRNGLGILLTPLFHSSNKQQITVF